MQLGLELHHQQLELLSENLKVALSAACAQRQEKMYSVFAERSKTGDLALFTRALDSMWREVLADQRSRNDFKILDDQVTALIPSPVARHGIYMAHAEFAVLSLAYCISARVSGNSSDVIHAARQCFESIDNFLLSPTEKTPEIDQSHPNFEAQILTHPLMQAEHLRQERDLSDVQHANVDTMPSVIAQIRQRAEIDSKSFLPAEVVETK
jgi:uncharacterized protein YjaG (DUF416 family)